MTPVVGVSTLFETHLADDAAALWLLEDESFVCTVFDALVEDDAATSAGPFVMLLRQGFSKYHVLAAIADCCSEGFRPGRLPGIRRRLDLYRWSRMPIVGQLVRLGWNIPGDSDSERRLRVIENQVYLLAKSMCALIGDAEFPVAPWGGLHRMKLLQELSDAESGMSSEIRATYEALIELAYRGKSVGPEA